MLKKTLIYLAISIIIAIAAVPSLREALWDSPGETRPAHVAGNYYPEGPNALSHNIDHAMSKAKAPAHNRSVQVLIAPYAKHELSSDITAKAYAQVKGKKYKRVVIIAPAFASPFSYASIYHGGAYETPLGVIRVDKAFADKLTKKSPHIKRSAAGHGCTFGRCEHALEVQLPFLQRSLDDFKIVPIMMGKQNYEVARALGVALAELIKEESAGNQNDTLIVASTDLSQKLRPHQASFHDQNVLNAIKAGDYLSLSHNLEQGTWNTPGGGAIVAAMIASERLGAYDSVILDYKNSGDITKDASAFEGFGAVVILRDGARRESPSASAIALTDQDKTKLLDVAKASVESAAKSKAAPPLPQPTSGALASAHGVFVTLKKNGQLRGRIGFVAPSRPLAETVRHAAAMAAMNDSRFFPVSESELEEIAYEISVLSPLRRVNGHKDIKIGRDGVLIRKGDDQGVYLPQVAVENGWDATSFLKQVSLKAGLPDNAWQSSDADIFTFTSIVFGTGGKNR